MTDADRARGLMVGIAVGNLLGIRVEGWSRRNLEWEFPDGIRDITAGFGYPDDDDLAQAIIVAEAASAGGLDIDDLGRRFWDWAEVNGAGMGGLTHRALALYGGAPPQRLARNRSAGEARSPKGLPIAEASRQAWEGGRAGNGALMRCAPLAIRWQHDPVRLVRESLISAVPTHWDPRCGWSCAVANLAVAGSLRQEPLSAGDLLRLATEGVAAGMGELERYGYHEHPPASVEDAVEEASEAVLDDLRFDGDDMGFTLLTLKAALDFVLAGRGLRIGPAQRRRGRRRYGYQRRRRRCNTRRAFRIGGDSRPVAGQNLSDSRRSGADGAVRGSTHRGGWDTWLVSEPGKLFVGRGCRLDSGVPRRPGLEGARHTTAVHFASTLAPSARRRTGLR